MYIWNIRDSLFFILIIIAIIIVINQPVAAVAAVVTAAVERPWWDREARPDDQTQVHHYHTVIHTHPHLWLSLGTLELNCSGQCCMSAGVVEWKEEKIGWRHDTSNCYWKSVIKPTKNNIQRWSTTTTNKTEPNVQQAVNLSWYNLFLFCS